MFDIAQLVVHQPLPAGDRVAVVVNAHALAALTADAALSWGLRVTHGPVALDIEASLDEYAVALRAALDDPGVDSVLTSFIPATYTEDPDIAAVVRDVVAGQLKPCAAAFVGMRGVQEQLAVEQPRWGPRRIVPTYTLPEDAARALAAATRYTQWRARARSEPVSPFGIDHDAADEIIEAVLADDPNGRRLTPDEARRLLATHGIDLWPWEVVTTADEAVEAAGRLGLPSVLQVRTARGQEQAGPTGLRADLEDADDVREAFLSLADRMGALPDDWFVIQAMSPPGTMCSLSTTEDPMLGPVLAFFGTALGTPLPGDVGYRVAPLSDEDVDELSSPRRGSAGCSRAPNGKESLHMDALRDVVARLSVLADEHPQVASVVLNPVNCWAAGVDVLGGVVTVAPGPPVRIRRVEPWSERPGSGRPGSGRPGSDQPARPFTSHIRAGAVVHVSTPKRDGSHPAIATSRRAWARAMCSISVGSTLSSGPWMRRGLRPRRRSG